MTGLKLLELWTKSCHARTYSHCISNYSMSYNNILYFKLLPFFNIFSIFALINCTQVKHLCINKGAPSTGAAVCLIMIHCVLRGFSIWRLLEITPPFSRRCLCLWAVGICICIWGVSQNQSGYMTSRWEKLQHYLNFSWKLCIFSIFKYTTARNILGLHMYSRKVEYIRIYKVV